MSFIVGLAAFFAIIHLYHKVGRLEQQLHRRNGLAPVTVPRPMPAVAGPLPIPDPASVKLQPPVQQPSSVDEFGAWIKEDFLMKLGAGLLLLALAWFVSYAFANNWIGPFGRIALGLITSAAVMAGGVWRMVLFARQGSVLVALGGAGVLMTVFAAREIYDMFTPGSALALAFLTAVFIAFVSVRYQRRSLVYAGLIIGSIAPLMVNVSHPDATMFFLYLLLLAVGTLWVVWVTGWTGLILASLTITGSYSLTYLLQETDRMVAITFSFLFVSLYYGTNMVSLIRRHGQGKRHIAIHTAVAAGTAMFLFAWIQTAIPSDWQSLVYVAWALVFAFGAYVVYTFTANYPAFYLYTGVSAALVAFATAAELSGLVLAIAYIIEISCMLFVLYNLLPVPRVLAGSSLLFAVPMSLSIESLYYRHWSDVFGLDFITIFLLAIATGVASWLLHSVLSITENNDHDQSGAVQGVLAAIGYGYAGVLVWSVCHLLFYGVGTALALVLFTLVGVILLVRGQAQSSKGMKMFGGVAVGFVVVRLLLIEVWYMPIELRIIAFVVIGVLLMATAFMGKRLVANNSESHDQY